MQIIMWVVLGTSVALAAMLDYHLRRAQLVELSEPIADAPITFHFPAGWKNWTRQVAGDAVEHIAQDSNGGVQRSLIVDRQRLPRPIPPAEYILRALPMSGNLDVEDFRGTMIDGWPGQTIRWTTHRLPLGEGDEYTFCAAVVLPDDQAIMIRLIKNAPIDSADQHLYDQILAKVQISTPPPVGERNIELSHDITVSVPSDLSLYPKLDSLRSERMAAAIADDGGWVSAVFVPVAVPGSEPSLSLVAGLSAREQLDSRDPGLAERWLSPEVTAQGPNHWTLSPQDAPNEAVAPRRIAHLLTGDGGWGLLVILSAEPPATRADLDHLWDELSANIHVPKSEPLVADLQQGASLASAARQAPPMAPWSIWAYGPSPIGFTSSDPKYPSRYTARRNWNGSVTAVVQQWGVGADGTPGAVMKRFDAESDPGDPLISLFDEATTVSDTITTVIRDRTGREISTSMAANPAFVLSRYFPSLLQHVTEPAAFWTDRFPGVEAEKFPSPLLLLTRKLEDTNGLITIEAEVNGTGSISRWYFNADGSLDHADFAGDLHLRPASRGEVESAFAGDRRLTIQPH